MRALALPGLARARRRPGLAFASPLLACVAVAFFALAAPIVPAQAQSVGAAMFVTLHSGRSFSGRVAWCEGSSVGMRFDRQLMPTDPLLFG